MQLRGCANKSHVEIIQRYQNIALRTVDAAYRYDRNDTTVHRDNIMTITSASDEIAKFAREHEIGLNRPTNQAAISLPTRQLPRH